MGLVAVMVLAMLLATSSLSGLSPVPDLEALLRMGLAVLALLLALVTLSDHPFHRNRRPGGPEGGP
jgi:hypothetical protein